MSPMSDGSEMQSDDKPTEAHLCGLCGNPKSLLREATEITHSPIYVCSTILGKAKMPCDGNLYKIATKS
jgi:hypothetical protein